MRYQVLSKFFRLLTPTFFIGCFFVQSLSAQWLEKIELEGAKLQTVSVAKPVSAIVVRGGPELFLNTSLLAGSETFVFTPDEHIHLPHEMRQSNLIVFSEPLSELIFYDLPSQLTEIFMLREYALRLPFSKALPQSPCSQPPIISQDEWRAGLPAPDYTRIRTQVRHIIVHHSATSNSLVNYAELVRSIYLQHTQVNEWSDIGYNYLIAPDGSIFAGRDPGTTMEQDEVLGAHFCASNTGTLGICMLGTFMNTMPTDSAMASLLRLMAWKTAKDSLSPYGFMPHPRNPVLGIIAGHRDGCATLCPGDALYGHLHPIKENCNSLLESCGVFLAMDEIAVLSWEVFPNPVTGNQITIRLNSSEPLHYKYIIRLYNQFGAIISHTETVLSYGELSIPFDVKAGIYLLQIYSGNRVFSKKIVRS